MFEDFDHFLYRSFQLIIITVVVIVFGVMVSFHKAYDVSIMKFPPKIFFQILTNKVKTRIRFYNYKRKKVFLLPQEIDDLHGRLFKKDQELKSEKEFKEALINQVKDKSPYIVISLTENRMLLKQRDKILRRCSVATGSGKTKDLNGKKYHFFTPRTIFTVIRKEKDPIWIMPDWAFYEEGLTPPKDREMREMSGILGGYGLYLQNGYMIHGTINPKDLGKYITHGCIRSGANDLKAIYEFVPVGTKVYVY
jgi:L,D-transpeptidase-like protein